MENVLIKLNIEIIFNTNLPIGWVFCVLRRLLSQNFGLILFENLFKPRQLYLQPQSCALSYLHLAS